MSSEREELEAFVEELLGELVELRVMVRALSPEPKEDEGGGR